MSIMIDDKAMGYPCALSKIERGSYHVQFFWDRNLGGRSISLSSGNMCTKQLMQLNNTFIVFNVSRYVENIL